MIWWHPEKQASFSPCHLAGMLPSSWSSAASVVCACLPEQALLQMRGQGWVPRKLLLSFCPAQEGPTSAPATHSQQLLLLLSAAPLHLPDYIFKSTSCVSNLKLQVADNRCRDLKWHPKHFKNTLEKLNTWAQLKRSNNVQRLWL